MSASRKSTFNLNASKLSVVALCLAIVGCEEQPLLAVGQLESDRVELVAEYAEAITSIAVKEGDSLLSGDVVLSQTTDRVDIQIAEASANIERLQSLLQEQLNGPRPETIAVVESSLKEATIEQDYRERELQRANSLRAQNLASVESVDNAKRLFDSAQARIANIQAQLTELLAGTRVEQIDQTRNQIQQAQAQLAALQLNRDRLHITAPVAAIVDSLPFEVGERPRSGDVVAVLLTGTQPYARLYIPEIVRASIQPGSVISVSVDGIDGVLQGTVRRIASEASFTPYFALTERDRGRLTYVAEVTLPEQATRLPEGLPVQVVFN